MTFWEAYKKVCEDEYKEMDFCDSEYYYGGSSWLEWGERSQMNVENPEIVGNVFRWHSCVRRPYYRMRGKPVTEEQAKEIILRNSYEPGSEQEKDRVLSVNFDNWWLDKNHSPFGWCHPDGTIGVNGMMQTYPNSTELLEEMYCYACEFPFLDFVILIFNIDEQNYRYSRDEYKKTYRNYSEFDGIDGWRENNWTALGIHMRCGHFDFLSPNEGMKLYKEYAEAYEPKGIDEHFPETNPYDIEYYSRYSENLERLLRYDYIGEKRRKD